MGTPIPRVAGLSEKDFHEQYFGPAKGWTMDNLVERVGDNEVWVRGKTNAEDYRVGKAYTIRKDTFGNYCRDLIKGNARARSSYLAVASMQQAFPQLQSDVP